MNYRTIDDVDTINDYISQAVANLKTARFQVEYWTKRILEENNKMKALKARKRELAELDFIPY